MMLEDRIIRKTKSRLLAKVVYVLLGIVSIIIYYCKHRNEDEGEILMLCLLGVSGAIGVLVYMVHEYRERYYEIVLSNKGIDLRNRGFFPWEMIDSFSTLGPVKKDADPTFMILHFKEYADLPVGIGNLDLSPEDLIDLVLEYGKSSGVYYKEHNKGVDRLRN